MQKKQLICGLSTLLLYAGFVAPARADFTPIPLPNAAYQAITNKLPVGVEGDPDVSSIADVTQTASFFISGVSVPLHIYDVGIGWATWSSPPFSESATPEVLGATAQLDIQLTNSSLVFGFEAEPNFFATTVITANFFGGGALHELRGSIQQSVTGDGGAMLFAGFSNGGIDDIQISSTDASFNHPEFGIAQLRYGNISPVPEPKYMLLLAGVGVLLVLVRSRQISGSRP